MSSIAVNVKIIPFKYIPYKDVPNFLFYSNMELTDTYFIKNVYSKDNICWVQIPTVNVLDIDKNEYENAYTEESCIGKYLTTCKIKGVAIFTDCEDVAFGKVLKVLDKKENYYLVEYGYLD